MKAIVLLFALTTTSVFADEYTPVDWIQLTEDGGVEVKLGFLTLRADLGCIEIDNTTLNDVTYSVRVSKWQMRRGEDSDWIDLEGTERNGAICGLGYIPDEPGEYRPVAEILVDGEVEKYTAGNTLIIEGEAKTETPVRSLTWGLLKVLNRGP